MAIFTRHLLFTAVKLVATNPTVRREAIALAQRAAPVVRRAGRKVAQSARAAAAEADPRQDPRRFVGRFAAALRRREGEGT